MKYLMSFLCVALLLVACEGFEKPEKPFPLHFQKTAGECGPACLKMVSDHYGGDYTFETLALISQMKPYEGTTLGQISDAATMMGLYNLAVKIDYQTLLDEAPYPAMLHWDGHHFLVVYKMDKDSIWLADPARGYVSYTKEEFLPHWIAKDTINPLQEGYALIFEPTDSFSDPRTKIKVQIQSKIEKKKKETLILQDEDNK